MKFLVGMTLIFAILFSAVDINSANKNELMHLKGIGNKKAEAIIAYRTKHCFKNISQITKVKGIGSKFLEKNRSELNTGTCKK